jgi:diphthine synthase
MALYLIGLGLNMKSITREGREAIDKCKKIYLENYTVDFPYKMGPFKEIIGKKFEEIGREKVESLELVDEAKKKDVALLVYGSPLTATTHITLIAEAKRMHVKCKVMLNASIFDAVALTGLQLYKFGKVASMPAWKKSYTPDSFMDIVKQNMSMLAHSLILIDIGLDFREALKQLEISAKNHDVKLRDLIVCQGMGTKNARVFYKDISELKELREVKKPYCLIIPSKMHFAEKEVLESFD